VTVDVVAGTLVLAFRSLGSLLSGTTCPTGVLGLAPVRQVTAALVAGFSVMVSKIRLGVAEEVCTASAARREVSIALGYPVKFKDC
jgi:hypothetical protein